MAQEIIDHLEKYLGTIQRGWGPEVLEHREFQIVECRSHADPDAAAYATLGLHRHALVSSGGSAQFIRHELFVLAPTSVGEQHFPAILDQVATEALAHQRPYLRGEVIGPRGQLAEGSSMEAFYVSIPTIYPDEFAVCSVDGDDVIIVMLVPITGREAEFVKVRGWSAFEDRLVETGADVLNLSRPCTCSRV